MLLKNYLRYILFSIGFFAFQFAFAGADTLIINSDSEDVFFGDKYLEIYHPLENDWLGPAPGAFIPDWKDSCKVRFNIKNSSANKRFYIEFQDPHVQEISLLMIKPDSINYGVAGFSLPFYQRNIEHKNFLYRLEIPKDSVATYEVHFGSSNPFGMTFRIRSDEFLFKYSLREYILLGMYYGILLIMAVYNLFIYFSVREKVYLLYVSYVLSCFLVSFSEDGIGFQYLWPEYPYMNHVFSILAPVFLLFSFFAYSDAFLELKNSIRWVVGSLCLCYIILYTFFNLGYVPSELAHVSFFAPFIAIYIGGLFIYRKGFRPARFFLVGYSFIIISIGIFILRHYGLVPTNLFTVYSFNISYLLEVVILSAALGDRFKMAKKEKEYAQLRVIQQLRENEKLKDAVNRELEEKVKEKTLALSHKNEELAGANDKLEDAYRKLQAQSKEIEKINSRLKDDNQDLKLTVKELARARVMFRDVSFEEFSRIYPDDFTCYQYLADLKWKRKFSCRKCSANSWSEGKTPCARRCTKCGYEESATAFTIFHRNRISLAKAFYMVFLVSTSKRNISSQELSRKLDLRQKTCWSFKQKVISTIQSAGDKKSKTWGDFFLTES